MTKNIGKDASSSGFSRTIILDKNIFDRYITNDYGDSFV